jgi:hypothetical protein
MLSSTQQFRELSIIILLKSQPDFSPTDTIVDTLLMHVSWTSQDCRAQPRSRQHICLLPGPHWSVFSQALSRRIDVNATPKRSIPTRSTPNLPRRLTSYTPKESLQPEQNSDPLDHARLTLRPHILIVVEQPPAWDFVILWVTAPII